MRTEACLLCFGLLLSACGATKSAHAELDSQVPAQLRADYQSFLVKCSKCHDVERALNAHVNDVRHWDLYVAKMMRTPGSAINKVAAPKILRFLHWYTGHKNRDSESENAKHAPVEQADEASTTPAAASAGAEAPREGEPAHPATENTSPVQATQGDTAP